MALEVTIVSQDFDENDRPIRKRCEDNDITIGRSDENDIVIDCPEISGVHARIRVISDIFTKKPVLHVADLGSLNGTFVGENRLTPNTEMAVGKDGRFLLAKHIVRVNVVEDDIDAFDVIEAESEESPETDVTSTVESLEDTIADYLIFDAEQPIQLLELDHSDEESSDEVDQTIEDAQEERVVSTLDNIVYLPVKNDNPLSAEAQQAANDDSGFEFDWEADECSHACESCSKQERHSIGSADSSIVGEVDGTDLLGLDFEAKRLCSVRGIVTDKAGNGIAEVVVCSNQTSTTMTDAQGAFQFQDLVEGTTLTLTFEKEGIRFDTTSLVVTAGDEQEHVVKARRVYQISGVVRHLGEPMSGVTIDGGELGKVTTDETGQYVFNDVPDRTQFILKAQKDGFVFPVIAASPKEVEPSIEFEVDNDEPLFGQESPIYSQRHGNASDGMHETILDD